MSDNSLLYGSQDNAMTEIALALAMGFFSLMVLTLVSMGSESTTEAPEASIDGIKILDADAASRNTEMTASNDVFVMYWGDNFYDHNGDAIDPRSLTQKPGGRTILVVDPSSPLSEIVKAKAILPANDVIVVRMSAQWVEALSAKGYQP